MGLLLRAQSPRTSDEHKLFRQRSARFLDRYGTIGQHWFSEQNRTVRSGPLDAQSKLQSPTSTRRPSSSTITNQCLSQRRTTSRRRELNGLRQTVLILRIGRAQRHGTRGGVYTAVTERSYRSTG